MTVIEDIKRRLKLGKLSSKFYDFVCQYYGFAPHHDSDIVLRQLAPWFLNTDETVEEFNNMSLHSQFYAEYVQQKYRIALEFCACEAGFDKVVLYDMDTGAMISGGMFWLKDCHPQPVRWTMTVGDQVIARGSEEPNTLNLNTMEEWLLDRILSFAQLKKKVKPYGEPCMEESGSGSS